MYQPRIDLILFCLVSKILILVVMIFETCVRFFIESREFHYIILNGKIFKPEEMLVNKRMKQKCFADDAFNIYTN